MWRNPRHRCHHGSLTRIFRLSIHSGDLVNCKQWLPSAHQVQFHHFPNLKAFINPVFQISTIAFSHSLI